MSSPDAQTELLKQRQRPLTVAEYHLMIEAGILGEDDRVELIRGVQLPLTFVDSEPEPDFAVVPHSEGGEGDDHPRTAALVIEVAKSSERYDRLVKAPLYAEAGVPEYWIVDLNARQVQVRRDPDPASGEYRSIFVVNGDDTLSPAAFPGVQLNVRDMLA